ncbi:MAG: AAA family ATPase [Chloroflexi bacterium]|nr:AAA family ATPase [Chloroflexota bacterium]
MKVVSVVGMAGAGKSEVARTFEEHDFTRVRFGDLTDDEIKKRGLEPGEKSERHVRELLRRENGMAVFAKLNLPRIDAVIKRSNVVIDGLYSWEEYLFLKDYYKDDFYVVAVWSPPALRYQRLMARKQRGLTLEEAASRDKAEIENTNKGGPIAMADCTVLNLSSLPKLRNDVERIIASL